MAWLLILTSSNPKATSWKAGDVVEVRSEAFVAEHGWGSKEGPPLFYRVHVPDLDAAQVKAFLEAQNTADNVNPDLPPTVNRVRRHHLAVSALPVAIQTTLAGGGDVTIPLTRFQSVGKLRSTRPHIRPFLRDDANTVAVLP
jgi:hypothetical protein